jgi:hypothetical protein
MRIVVVGGQGRKVGKTSVIAGLIRGLRRLHWTAVKISMHDGRIPHCDHTGEGRAGPDCGFILTEETKVSTFTDTGRFLAAGARRAVWLRVKTDCLLPALAVLFRALANEPNVIIESGSAMSVITPRLGVVILDHTRREMKANARRAIARTDAVVEIVPGKRSATRSSRLSSGARRFAVTRKSYSNPKLVRFVLLRLQHLGDGRITASNEVAAQERN